MPVEVVAGAVVAASCVGRLRELKLVDGRYKVVNGLGEFFFEIRADRES